MVVEVGERGGEMMLPAPLVLVWKIFGNGLPIVHGKSFRRWSGIFGVSVEDIRNRVSWRD